MRDQGCLPFTQTMRVEILCIDMKLRYMWWENDLRQSISKLAEQTEMSREIASSQITAFSEAFQTRWRKPFDFPTGISSFPM